MFLVGSDLLFSRSFRSYRSRVILIWLVLLVLAASYIVLMASWQSTGDRFTRFRDILVPRTLDVVIGGWLFFIGSSIGSFLNVVAWRMPRGESINGRSHCPRCMTELSWRDNWPVFGWLALRGRCRTCHLPISPRYPIVELVVGLSVLVVGGVEFASGSASLPFHPTAHGRTGALWTPHVTADSIATMAYHVVAIAVVWAFGLVRFDGHRLPRQLVAYSLAMIVLPMLFYPGLAVVPWQVTSEPAWQSDGRYLDALMRVITGLAAAAMIGRALSRNLAPNADPKIAPLDRDTGKLIDLITILCVPAMVVGWQAVIGVAVLSILLAWVVHNGLRLRQDAVSCYAIALPVALAVQLCLWRRLHDFSYWPSVGTAPLVILAWAAAILVLPRILTFRRDARSTSATEA